MRLLRVHLQNFRSFRDTTIDLEDVTVLIGPNDAGKSSILEALRFLLNRPEETPWTRAELQSKPSFHPGNPEAYETPGGAVVVTGELGDFTPDEQDRLSPLIVEGVIRIGAYIGENDYGDLTDYRGPCWVLPEGSPILQSDGDRRLLFFEEPPWLHEGNLFVAMDRVSMGIALWSGLAVTLGEAPYVPSLVWLPGPDRRPPSARSLLQPLIEEVIKRKVANLPPGLVKGLGELTLDVEDAITSRISTIVPRYVPGALSAALTTTHWDPAAVVRTMLRLNADSTEIYVQRGLGSEDWDQEDRGRPPGSDPESSLGAGARRALALGVLELYGNAEVWPPNRPVLLALEEPEAGLHPAAQRQVARSLQSLSTKSGVQAIIVTHSPTMIDAVPMSAIRLVRAEYDPTIGLSPRVYAPHDLAEIADVVGTRPSDILLADHFVIVEGLSDVEVFGSWARKLGIRIESAKTVLVSADGWSKAEVVAKLMRLAYPGSRVDVVLDGGAPTEEAQADFARRFGSSVQVHRLSKPEIEAYLPTSAIDRWLVAQGSLIRLEGGLEIRRPGPRQASEALNRLALKTLHRPYHKPSDTSAIANLVREEEVPPEISELLIQLLANG